MHIKQYDRIIKPLTNNICEGFHSFLNRTIEVNWTKNSLFADYLKVIAINNYNKFINNIFNSDIGMKIKLTFIMICINI